MTSLRMLNCETGEVLEPVSDVKFRSAYNTGAYKDNEVCLTGSMVEDDNYEPLESLLARCMRREVSLNSLLKNSTGLPAGIDEDDFLDVDEDDYQDDLTTIDALRARQEALLAQKEPEKEQVSEPPSDPTPEPPTAA